ncbi:PqqD family protein [Terriglobus sp. YAF25]|uniref:PqqD family protein n=1 Tax=Terriglobus sp. YAF25 TaxID=3233080 RepID=UPI003F996225
MDQTVGAYYGLDTIGSEIWRRLQHGPEVGVMVRELAETYHHDAAEVERDVLALMEKMREQNLIRRVS